MNFINFISDLPPLGKLTFACYPLTMKALMFSPYSFIPLPTLDVSLTWWCSMVLSFDCWDDLVLLVFIKINSSLHSMNGSFLGGKKKKKEKGCTHLFVTADTFLPLS